MIALEDYAKRLQAEMSEPLHPDLVPYFETDGALGAQLRHPLVYQVPFFSPGSANAYYIQKKEDLITAVLNREFNRIVYLHERPYRLEAFKQIAKDLPDTKYWSLLASIWVDTENQWQHLDKWKQLLSSDRPNRHYMMSEESDRTLTALDDEVTIYRGCQKGLNENGLSWTLDKSVAKFFANRFGKKGIILEKKISKKDIVAIFLSRNESEVIYEERG